MGQGPNRPTDALRLIRAQQKGIEEAGGPTRPVRSHVNAPPASIRGLSDFEKLTEKRVPHNADEPLSARSPFAMLFPEPRSTMPSMEDVGSMSPAMGIVKKSLPIIAPEAYEHVKAGGLRLYSRLTDAFAKAPNSMKPAKAMSVARQGASQEEFNLRKLGDFLKTKDIHADIPRQEIMDHLSQNPLELDVVRKGAPGPGPQNSDRSAWQAALDAENQFIHRMETQAGPQWYDTANEETRRQYHELVDARDRLVSLADMESDARYDWLQTPGPKENYGETLINLPKSQAKGPITSMEEGRELFIQRYGHEPRDPDDVLEIIRDRDREAGDFISTHWDEPNNLVWSRYNDRYLNPDANLVNRSKVQDDINRMAEVDDELGVGFAEQHLSKLPQGSGSSKGRFIEEIQSDWHQQGREHGYRTPETIANYYDLSDQYRDIQEAWRNSRLHSDDQLWGKIGEQVDRQNPRMAGSRHDAMTEFENYGIQSPETFTPDELEAINEYMDFRKQERELLKQKQEANPEHWPPDAPFKDTYHELALKEQLLDAANRDDLEWLGVADADTVSRMEGHNQIRPGTELYYNQKHPSALEKLLNPLGGQVEHTNLPPNKVGDYIKWGPAPGHPNAIEIGYGGAPTNSGVDPIVTALPGITHYGNEASYLANQIKDREIPGPGMWKANLPPELKQLIKERGFPAMSALLALAGLGQVNERE